MLGVEFGRDIVGKEFFDNFVAFHVFHAGIGAVALGEALLVPRRVGALDF